MTQAESLGLCQTEFCRKLSAATAASALSIISTTPFDVIKTRMQAQAASGTIPFTSQSLPQRHALSTCPNLCAATRLPQTGINALCPPECYVYLSTRDAFFKITRQEGVKGLWKGAPESFMIAVPMVGLYLPLYDAFLERLDHLGVVAPVLAGSCARTIAIFFVAPLEILRTRIQSMQMTAKGTPRLEAFDWGQGRSWRHRLPILWRGYSATVARDIPFTAVYWALVEPMRRSLLEPDVHRQSLPNVILANATAAAISGLFASAVTTPMDVVKTRTQIAQSAGKSIPGPFQTLMEVYQHEGLRGLFSGVGPRMIRAAPSCAIVLSTYEICKKIL